MAQPSQPPTTPPPEQAPGRGAGVDGAIGATAAAETPAVVAGASVATAASIAAEIVKNTAKFLIGRRGDDLIFITRALRTAHPEMPVEEVSKLAQQELGREKAFRQKMLERLQRDLPEALRIANPEARSARVQQILEREKRYLAMRQDAMLDRAIAEAELRTVRAASPQGAYWKLSPLVQEHTLDCIALGEKFWPWEVLNELHPPTHHGCRCQLYTLGEATERGLMTPDQVPDKSEAIGRARQIVKQFGLLKESLTAAEEREIISELVSEAQIEEAYDRHQLDEVHWERRFPAGTAKGGEFMPRRGGSPGRRIVRDLVGHLMPPALAGRRRAGKWHRLSGRSVFVPEQRRFERRFGATDYVSPAGTSDVFVGGRPYLESRGRPLRGKLSVPTVGDALTVRDDGQSEAAFRLAAYAADRNRSTEVPVAVGHPGTATVEGLETAGFHEMRSGEGAGKLWMEFAHPSGARLRVTFSDSTGRVTGADWKPGRNEAAPRDPVNHPPLSYREFQQRLGDFVQRESTGTGTAPHFAGVQISREFDDHAGMHEADGTVLLGPQVMSDIERAGIEREHRLAVADPGNVFASYRVGYHEASHAVNPMSMRDYAEPHNAALEEALTEESAMIHAFRELDYTGQRDVLRWVADNPTDHRVLGTYPGFRKRLDDLLNQAKIDPAARPDFILKLKNETSPTGRYSELAKELVAAGAYENDEVAAFAAAEHMRSGEYDIAGFAPQVPSPTAGRAMQFETVRGQPIGLGSRVLVRNRVVDREATAGGAPVFKTTLEPATITDIGHKLEGHDWVASAELDGGGTKTLLPGDVTRLLPDEPKPLRIDGRDVNPGDGIRYDNQRDGSYRDATVERVLRRGQDWAVEATVGDNRIILTRGRTGAELERQAPVTAGEPVLPATPPVFRSVSPSQPDLGAAGPAPSPGEARRAGAAYARTRQLRAAAGVEEAMMALKAHMQRRAEMHGSTPDPYDVGRMQGMELGRRALLNGAGPEDLLRVAGMYGPRRGGSDQNEGLQTGLRAAAVEVRDLGPEVSQYGTRSPSSGKPDPKLFYGDAADDPHGFAEFLKSMGAGVPEKPGAQGEPDVPKPVEPDRIYGGELLEDPESKVRYRVVGARGTSAKLDSAQVEDLQTHKRRKMSPDELAKLVFIQGPQQHGKSYVKEPPLPKTTDDGELTVVKGAGGMGGAVVAEDSGGQKWIVKGYRGNVDRVATELVANRIYRELGVAVPEAGLRDLQGKPALAYQRVEGDVGKRVTSPNAELGKSFMADALLANWDVMGLEHDNILWQGEKPVRLDQGGTMQMRALGSRKPFGPVPSEVWSMRSPKGQAFGTMDVSEPQLREQARKIADTLTPDVIHESFADAPFADPVLRDEQEKALVDRVGWMRRFADGEEQLPQPVAGAEARQMFRDDQGGVKLFPEQALALEKFPTYLEQVQSDLRARKKKDEVDKHVSFLVGELDSLTRHVRTREDVSFLMPVKDVGAEPDSLVGKTFSEPGFLVGQLDEKKARKEAKGGVMFRVLAPAGSHVLAPRELPEMAGLKGPEILGQRGVRLRVVRREDVQGIPYLEAVLLP